MDAPIEIHLAQPTMVAGMLKMGEAMIKIFVGQIVTATYLFDQAGVVIFNSARDLTPDLMDSAQTQIDIRLHFVGVKCFAEFQGLMSSAGNQIIGTLFKLNITDMQQCFSLIYCSV